MLRLVGKYDVFGLEFPLLDPAIGRVLLVVVEYLVEQNAHEDCMVACEAGDDVLVEST